MNNDEAFNKLCLSALEFLNQSIDELENKPKFALLHFCTAVELVLKARLLKEHWSLVVTRTPDHRSFQSGNFHSVTPDEAISRLEKICNDSISNAAEIAFKTTIKHRNSVMHFYHTDEGKDLEEFRKQVAGDVCGSVYHLELCLRKWREHFLDFSADFNKAFTKARSVRSYLDISFKNLSPELEKLKKTGVIIGNCKSCGFNSAIVTRLTDKLFDQKCKICDVSEASISIACEDCGVNHTFSEYEGFQIKDCECGYQIDQQEFCNRLETRFFDRFASPINCALCYTPGSILQHNDYFICSECLGYSDVIAGCEWCHEAQMGGGELDSSYYSGCEFCGGQAGWHSDN